MGTNQFPASVRATQLFTGPMPTTPLDLSAGELENAVIGAARESAHENAASLPE
jgi:hypothetical protein